MPPISEKRGPPHIKENTKENISKSLNGKGPEILDFRESWLQEIEMYKDHIRAQQLLTAHNHIHTVEGCHKDIPREGIVSVKGVEPVKRRARTRSESETYDNKSKLQKDYDDELVLKRAREDIGSKNHGNNIYRNAYPNAQPQLSPTLNGKTQTNASTTESMLGPKIIMNTYHASSLLNSQQLDKSQLVMLNGVPFAAAASASPINNFNDHSSGSGPVFANNNSKHLEKTNKSKLVKEIREDNLISIAEETKQENEDLIKTISKEAINLNKLENSQPETRSDDDGSNFDEDDEDFGDIDNVDAFDSSDDSDDEYVGYSFFINSDEEHDITNTQNPYSNVQYTTPKTPLTSSLFSMVPPYLTFSSHVEKGPSLPAELQKILKWKLSPVMPRIVRRVVLNSGFRLIKKTDDWMAVWEKHMKSPCFKAIRSHQKFNHLPGTFKIGRKDSVWRNLRTYISKFGKKEFGFMQKTFILPQEIDMLRKSWPKYAKKSTKWIVKPPASARGTGISVVSRWTEFPKQKPLIVQKYIEKPLLINNSKFDLRLYVIITSINPLRIFMHTDGLARFASVQYSDKLDTLNDRCMHLTNYSINKLSANYSKNEDINACQGHKWTLKSLWSYFDQRGINTKRLWGTLRNLVIKTILGGESCLNRMFKQNVNSRYNCYELFGFDVLLDEDLVPWLLEVNISPSLHSELPLDLHVKGPLIQAVLNTALYQVPPKLNEKQQSDILKVLNIEGPLCYDKRLYTTCLTQDEIKKHNQFTNRSIEYREEYLDSILDDLTPDDVRCLINAEDELARSCPLERIFPGPESHIYLKFVEGPRYYNRLLDAWETKYGKNRIEGINLLQKLCDTGMHLQVPPAALQREPSVDLVDVELLNSNLNRKYENSALPSKNDCQDITRIAQSSINDAVATPCSKQANIPQKKVNNEVYSSSRPITLEIK